MMPPWYEGKSLPRILINDDAVQGNEESNDDYDDDESAVYEADDSFDDN